MVVSVLGLNGSDRVAGARGLKQPAARARAHLEEAGLAEFVEIRGGNAPDSLSDLPEPVDFLLNDGFPPYALPVLQTVAPRMRPGAMVVSDNVALFPADHRDYIAWVRDPANGFLSTRIALDEGTELSVRAN